MIALPTKKNPWCVIANFIITQENVVENTFIAKDTKAETTFFTKWGEELAKEIGISKNTFWQYRRAGLLYTEIIKLLPAESNPVPLQELFSVTSEHLNELHKIARVAPPEMLKELSKRVVIEKSITRKELRAIWAALRPALEGENARGRKHNESNKLRISDENQHAQTLVIEGLVLMKIKKEIEKLFGKAKKPFLIDRRERYLPAQGKIIDALVFCVNDKDKNDFEIITHGLSLGWPCGDAPLKELKLNEKAYPCDMLWLVFKQDARAYDADLYANVPDFVGIIEAFIDYESVSVSSLSIKKPPIPDRVMHLRQQSYCFLAAYCRDKIQNLKY